MNPAIDKLLSQVYELEGLLLVVERHKGDVSSFVYEMIQKKAERIGELAPLCTPEIFPLEENKQEQTEEDIPSDELQQVVEEEKPVGDSFANEEGMEEVIEYQYNEIDEEYDASVDLDETEIESGKTYEDNNEFEADDIEENESEEESLRLDEVLQRTLSKDLSQAFSLNDRFRYRRELFSNSEVEMRNTINMVEAMQSFAEAEEYFYGDLEWDSESPEVKDFMTIIRNHFL